ncbi:capsular biosynthesis protein [Rhodobacter sp. NTK016B]|uniref:capsule biosynthesis protein n=1 Tax=Rhodobacter sp. NTK016B TaxID=2759676 RepID=UPI001A9093F9|nr:capsular biosynthesis protein [Rhodobacter sp. NTK016B]MBN8290760.1 capsular biosynthesis protein [Rhodobacter sp. NTK016B]
MVPMTGDGRRFLMLQGPHGPFFRELGALLRSAGAEVWRIGFNRGDEAYWGKQGFIPYLGAQEDWPARIGAELDRLRITDLILYGDTRFIHAEAVRHARARGIEVHIFEEGYLRPWWVTYERGGSNGNSRLMTLSVPEMRRALEAFETDLIDAPAHWGDMRQHVFYGVAYHARILLANRRYKGFRPHRAQNVVQEFWLHLKRLMAMPLHAVERRLATRRVRVGGFPYHLALLQLEHDSNFQQHSPFSTMTEFLEVAIRGFAEGAPPHHHLVFKAHPLEDGRTLLKSDIARLARDAGVEGRIHFIRGGKLAQLLNHARSAVTTNSTAAQQVLWRGMPLKVFGGAVYDKPEFVSTQPLAEFFAQPTRPDLRAYRDYRRFLLETSQLPGGFYSAAGRRQLLRQVVDMILSPEDPYSAVLSGRAAPRQHLRLVP